ncbi:helix-turn-helix domain-containing protein [Paenibacillus brevis]|uniref:Helix-turn-helix domain-containing protein n=1 Tax=Paenibacillus brevis TaxID=2841508 RepID=A0ABS6FJD5_9BACL|nr:helix-turn-helix transcriptional regulator [Paenibacillus brevis]MBU5670280.1 helix-turn-helix domain-containing protein [Paenibacillus brevis]
MAFRGDRVAFWRKKIKLTQEELAEKINLTKAAVSNYENGHSKPSDETLVAIADVLDVDTDYLLGRTDQPRSKVEDGMFFYGGPDKYTPDEIAEMDAALKRYREMKNRAVKEAERHNNQ